jgi:hypothetical protein
LKFEIRAGASAGKKICGRKKVIEVQNHFGIILPDTNIRKRKENPRKKTFGGGMETRDVMRMEFKQILF